MAVVKEKITLDTVQLRLLKELRGNGFSQEEIAQELGVSRKTVENHLRRLRANYKPLPTEAMDLIEKASGILAELLNAYTEQKKEK